MTPDDIFSKLYPPTRIENDISPSYQPEHIHNHTVTDSASLSPFPKETPLAMSYIYFQQWGSTNTPEKALEAGTLFPDLDKPFERGKRT